MVRLDDAVPARLKAHGTTFEVLVDPDGALALKRGTASTWRISWQWRMSSRTPPGG